MVRELVAIGALGVLALALALWRMGAAERLRAVQRDLDNLAVKSDGEYLG